MRNSCSVSLEPTAEAVGFRSKYVNGRFNEHLDGLDTELADSDRVSLMYPFIFCC